MLNFIKISFVILATCITCALPAQNSAYRRVLLFTNSNNDTAFTRQQEILKFAAAGCQERDIRVETYFFTQTDNSVLKKYGISSPLFTFLLIGKDGGTRLRSSKPISSEQLFNLIDAMPMRKDEIKRLKNQ
jgi:Domain of unknown function (DUF4174)